ncbi:MAG: TIGR04086 family membrane protein [bacterium]|nr:TIGR04086 family membrane protein [bacterium]
MRAQVKVKEAGPRLQPASILVGIAAAYAFAVVAAALIGFIMFRIRIPDPTVTVIMSVVSYAGMAAGGLFGARHAGTLGWAHGGLTGLGYVIIGLVLASLLLPGSQALVPSMARLGLGFALGAIGGTVGVNIS